MEQKISDGRASALALFDRVERDAPEDMVVRGRAFNFISTAEGLRLGFEVGQAPDAYRLHNHALNQVAAKARVPAAYLKDLLGATETWKHELACRILNDHFTLAQAESNADASNHRHLVRTVRGEVRGVLSDRYRRLDSRPLLDAFAGECKALGALPVEGAVTDTRLNLKAILPHVFEPVPGEVICIGGEWSNSDFGAGKHAFRAFIFRLWCRNGATMEDSLAQVHIGGRLSDDIEFSQRTYELDTRAQVSALRDVVRGVLSPRSTATLLETIRSANEKQVDWKGGLATKLGKRLLKEELKAVKDAFESQDVVNLPPVRSAWRASNAVSWIANATEDPERKMELQRLAGELINGRVDATEAA